MKSFRHFIFIPFRPLFRTSFFILFFILFFMTFSPVFPLSAAVIAENGTSGYKILLPKDASPAERKAAEELQFYVQKSTKAVPEIISEPLADGVSGRFLAVGRTHCAEGRVDFASLRDDEIRIETLPDGSVLLAGCEPRGTLNAVYTFLQDRLGVRWWSPECTYVPEITTLEIPDDFHVAYAPQMIYREVYHRLAWDVPFAAHNRLNGHHHRLGAEYGGHYNLLNWCHSFYRYISPEKYFAAHPEWFSEIDGVRTCDHAQLCLSNEEMTAEFIRNVLALLRENPDAKFIDVSQNDWFRFCTCERCRAFDAAHGGPSASHFAFINRVAEAVSAEFPDVLVESLAYQYTRRPPTGISLRDNVLVRLCSIECSFLKPLSDPSNQEFADDIAGWRKLAKQLFIWDYVTNYHDYIGPFPNLRAIGPNVQYFVKNGAVGIFEEAEGDDFVEMRNWVLAQLMWNPEQDPEALKREFMNGFYGKSVAPLLAEYLDVLHDRAEAVNLHLGCFGAKTLRWLDLPTLNRASEIQNEMMKISEETYGKDSAEFQHLRKTMLALESVWVYRYDSLREESRKTGVPFEGPSDPEAAARAFVEGCKEFKIRDTQIGQRDNLENIFSGIIGNYAARRNPPEICKNLQPGDWFLFDALGFLNIHNAAEIVPDAQAWNGKSVKMGTRVDWNTQFYPDFAGRYRIFASLRCEGTEFEGRLGSWGVYDTLEKKSVRTQLLQPEHFLVTAAKVKNGAESEGETGTESENTPEKQYDTQYRWVDFGVVEIPPGAYLWFAHAHSEKLDGIFLDRVLFLRQDSEKQ